MKTIVENYLSKEMDRKEFLRQIGLMLLAAFGVSSVLKYLADQSGATKSRRGSSNGYGSNNYGGIEQHSKSI